MNHKLLALGRLEQIIATLRGPGGCPWDRAQSLATMSRYFVEESCEVVDAVDESGGHASPSVREEIGDVLVNVFLASAIAEQSGGFDLAGAASAACDKLVRRHPHVFGAATADTVDAVLSRWNAIKAEEKRQRAETSAGAGAQSAPASRLDGVPRSLPALERAHEIGKKAARAGFDWPDAAGALAKVAEEVAEVKGRLAGSRDELEEELGDLLFAVVNVCRKLDIQPDAALRRATRKFAARFRHVEARLSDLETATAASLDALWEEAKAAGVAEGTLRNAAQLPAAALGEEP